MKTFAVLALASTASAIGLTAEEKLAQEDALYLQLDGAKGFYDGYTRAFYKINSHTEVNEECLNDTTMDNIVAYSDIINDPFSLLSISKIKEDLNLFAEGAEVMSDLSNCKFEQSVFDLMAMCKEKDENEESLCAMSHITENLTKNMFVLMGKLTGMAETMKDFPSEDPEEYHEQMRELGTDAGTFLRVLYNFQTPEIAEAAKHHDSSASRRHHSSH